MFFPLVVPPAKLAVPALGGLEIRHFAQSLSFGSDVLLGDQYFFIDFGVERELHLAVGGSTSALFSLAAVFLPSE